MHLVRYALFALVAVPAAAADPLNGPKTALDEYVAKPDPAYEWKVVKTVPGDGVTTFVIDLKSQSWRKTPDVDREVWQHWLTVVKPDAVKHATGFLMIGGGKNGSPAPDAASALTLTMAKATGSVVAELKMVPNQPLVLNNDGKPRSEDDLLAAGWIKFMDTGDPLWVTRLAMVKSAVRAMDTVTALMASEQGGKVDVKSFVVAGGSKRGWTTWLTGAVDKRVVAVVPIVIDVLNLDVCCVNHFCAYGFWAPAVGDYTRHKVFERRGTSAYDALLKLEDPYFYRDRFTMPKYVVNAAGDQFFPPDSAKFYFGDLPGPKYLRYVPNADHSLRNSDAQDSILAFYNAVLTKAPLPKFTWETGKDGSIRVKAEDKPKEVLLWQATNPKARDFRLESIGPAYKSSRVDLVDGAYVAKVDKPAAGWTAFFVELTFDSGGKVPYKFTTPVSIVPDVLPHKIEAALKRAD
ncbi:MAG TPA: PhoPQ-activated pathogenicity-related family protein [Gemmataceae bacterium]|jgi:PhoPQ-activated pathogenicity-related protein|nr:PhoPQ-activated pathogenicity-related family protein [Gemmataceae bacterium]